MNLFMFTGNLTADPTNGATANGTEYCNFTVACTDYNNKTSFFRVTTWRTLATACAGALSKGQKVLVKGSISLNQYERNGAKGLNVDVTAQEVEFLTPKNLVPKETQKQVEFEDLEPAQQENEELPF